MRMAERAMSMAQQHAPWRGGSPWWVTGVQGAILALIGLFLLLAPDAAGRLILQLIAAVLLLESLLHIVAEFRRPRGEANPYLMLQAGVGATVGLLVFVRGALVPTLDDASARNMLAWGLIAYALVGAAGALMARGESDSWLRPMVNALLLVILAIVLLTSSRDNAADRLAWLGVIALIGGAALLFLAWRANQRPRAA
jgi:uncharacterized membrane protein HdeD (DUF308 family)